MFLGLKLDIMALFYQVCFFFGDKLLYIYPLELLFAVWVGWLLFLLYYGYTVKCYHHYLALQKSKCKKRPMLSYKEWKQREKERKRRKKRRRRKFSPDLYYDSLSNIDDESLSVPEKLHLEGIQLSQMFDTLCDKSPLFSQFYGIENTFSLTSPSDYESYYCASPLPELMERTQNRRGFLYHNDLTKDIPIVFDSGATITVTPNRGDFYSYTEINESINGITESGRVVGEGMVEFTICDDRGVQHKVQTKALHVPKAQVRLLSVLHYCGTTNCSFHINGCDASFYFEGLQKYKLSFKTFDKSIQRSRLPIAFITRNNSNHSGHAAIHNVMASNNINLSTSQKELLGWHLKMAHFGMQWIQNLTKPLNNRDPTIRCKLAGTSTCSLPKCAACEYAKGKVHSDGAQHVESNKASEGGLKKDHLKPGSQVSTDQFVCSQKGRLLTGTGKGGAHNKYSGGTIYVDHASSYIHLENQVSLNAAETI